MVYNITYRRPASVQSTTPSGASITGAQKQQSIKNSISSAKSGMATGIPEALSFDRIIFGGTCPPCTTRDFMNYLKYIELAPENLQFYLWFRDYCNRFEALPGSEKSLSLEWTVEEADRVAAISQSNKSRNQKAFNSDAAAFLSGTDFASTLHPTKEGSQNPFHTPPATPDWKSSRSVQSIESDGSRYPPKHFNHAEKTNSTFIDAGINFQPFTVQPYREEISRIINIYISDGGTRELNLSSKERMGLLHALSKTTHPSAFRNVLTSVEWTLRCQAHPNFIRWAIYNGNRPRIMFARGLGVGGILLGIVSAVLLCLSSANRAWRVLSFLGFFIGISTLIAAWKGMCVVLHGMHRQHLRPWELFMDDDVSTEMGEKVSNETLASSNSWEDEPWVPKYQQRNLVRKVFDREVWIQEPELRQIQDTIFLQAVLGATAIGGVLTGIFCSLPQGGFF